MRTGNALTVAANRTLCESAAYGSSSVSQ
jgi:hypothetical protein